MTPVFLFLEHLDRNFVAIWNVIILVCVLSVLSYFSFSTNLLTISSKIQSVHEKKNKVFATLTSKHFGQYFYICIVNIVQTSISQPQVVIGHINSQTNKLLLSNEQKFFSCWPCLIDYYYFLICWIPEALNSNKTNKRIRNLVIYQAAAIETRDTLE